MNELSTIGVHNTNLPQSTIRILEGGSWLKQETIVILPAAQMVPTKAVMSWMNLQYPPNQAVQRFAAIGMEVGDAYSTTIEAILANPILAAYKFILTIEADNLPPADGVLRLLRQMELHPEYACIGGLYWTKYEGGVPQIWGDSRDPVMNFRPQPPIPNCRCGRQGCPLVECVGGGMGFNLFRLSMFADKKLERPLFRTKASLEEGVGTQDLSFWSNARKLGYRCAVDTSTLVGHMDCRTGTIW